MTAEQFISVVRNRLPKRFHEEVLRYNIGLAYAMFLSEQKDLEPFRKTYEDIAVQKSGNTYYALLPVQAANIDDAIEVEQTDGVGYIFEERSSGEDDLFEMMEVGLISDIIGFRRKIDRVIFTKNMDESIGNVDLGIVRPFEAYDYTEEFYLPYGASELILETVTNFVMGTPPDFDINDGSERTV